MDSEEIYCYDTKGKLVNKYDSIIDASIFLNINSNRLKYHIKSGKLWNRKFYFLHYKETNNLKPRNIYCFDVNGKLISKYNNPSDIVESLNLNYDSFYSAINNGRLHKHKFYFSWSKKFVPKPKKNRGVGLKSRFVYQFDSDGNFVDEHKSVREVSLIFNTIDKNIYSAIYGKNLFNLKYYFSYSKKFVHKKRKTTKPIYCFNEKGKLIKEFSSLIDASDELNIKVSNIFYSIKKKKIINGLYFSRNSDFKIPIKIKQNTVFQFDLEGKLIEGYETIYEAYTSVGSGEWNIKNSIKNKTPIHRKFFFSKDPNFVVPEYKETIKEDIPIKVKPIYQFNSNGELLKKFDSSEEASTVLKIPFNLIMVALSKKRLCNGYPFFFSREESIDVNKFKLN